MKILKNNFFLIAVIFLLYRYYTFGKGNKGLVEPTLFGW